MIDKYLNYTNDKNQIVSAGIYIYKIESNKFIHSKKMFLIKL